MSLCIKQHIQQGKLQLDVNLELPASGITAIFGPSGSGKTSLLRAIAGLDQHTAGHVIINGKTWQDQHSFMPVDQRSLAYVFQEDNLFEHLTVLGNLQYAAKRTDTAASELAKAVALLGIEHLLPRKPQGLSGGERQKVAIARALLVKPDLLLMDEPFAGLDLDFRDSFLPQLRQLLSNSGIPVLYVSHSPDEIAQLADTMVLLSPNAAVLSGSLNDMLTSASAGLATRRDAESVIDACVKDFDADFSLISLSFSGGIMSVPGPRIPVGQTVRTRILAQDVSLTLQHQENTSILNIFPVTIEALMPCSESQYSVLMTLGSDSLLARITRKSAHTLGLKTGTQLFAQIKSVAVLN